MELSFLLAENISAMFLVIAIGYVIVKSGLLKTQDSKIISCIVVYICSPCAIIDSFQIDLTQGKIQGLLLALVLSVIVNLLMLMVVKILDRWLHFNSIEKTSIIYTNCGYLVIPLVASVLGEEWVFYTTVFLMVQNIMTWTHCVKVLNQETGFDYKEMFLNSNMIATYIGLVMFLAEIRIPTIFESCISSLGNMMSPASMMVIGMIIGDVNLLWVFKQKRPYLICFIRLILIPVVASVAFAAIGHMGIHPDVEYILLIVLLGTIAPSATIVTQLAQIYNKDVRYASVINVMSVIFCIVTVPIMVMLFEFLY